MRALVTVRGIKNNEGSPITENEIVTVSANHMERNDYNFMELYQVNSSRSNGNSRTLKAAFNTHDVVSVVFEE